MKRDWKALFNGYGFEVDEVNGGFDLRYLSTHNRDFLVMLLTKLDVRFTVEGNKVKIHSEVVTKDGWVQQLKKHVDGRTESSFAPTEIPVDKLDVYISGVVMQLNRLGCIMVYSCDGHERGRPYIYCETADFARMAKSILRFVGVEVRRKGARLSLVEDRKKLPTTAVKLSEITIEQARKTFLQEDELISKEFFETNLESVLSIPGESGDEGIIRSYVVKELEPLVDHIAVDHFGNIVAMKRFGPGPTVLLNAHLDTYESIIVLLRTVKSSKTEMSGRVVKEFLGLMTERVSMLSWLRRNLLKKVYLKELLNTSSRSKKKLDCVVQEQ